MTNDEYYKAIVNKLGFYPENILNKHKNIKFFCNNLADSCLLYQLYQKVVNEESFSNMIHIHFDKYKAQASLYFEGVINDKITGFNYDVNKTLIENVQNVIDFVNKVSMVFGGFELSISYSDIDDK